jgi:DNA-binding response OmpR family regulator
LRVLILEEEPLHAADLSRELTTAGCDVLVVTDGATGLVHAVSERFDAVIASAELPGMNGFRVCSRIKKDANAHGHGVLVFLMSTHADAQFDAHRKLPTRADGYVQKPVRAADVSEMIATARERAATGGTAAPSAAPQPRKGRALSTLREALAAQQQARDVRDAAARSVAKGNRDDKAINKACEGRC